MWSNLSSFPEAVRGTTPKTTAGDEKLIKGADRYKKKLDNKSLNWIKLFRFCFLLNWLICSYSWKTHLSIMFFLIYLKGICIKWNCKNGSLIKKSVFCFFLQLASWSAVPRRQKLSYRLTQTNWNFQVSEIKINSRQQLHEEHIFPEFIKICLVKWNPLLSPLCLPSKRKQTGSSCYRKSRHGEDCSPGDIEDHSSANTTWRSVVFVPGSSQGWKLFSFFHVSWRADWIIILQALCFECKLSLRTRFDSFFPAGLQQYL